MTQESGKTKYYVLMEELKESILSGKIKAGEKLPSENQLSEKYHISSLVYPGTGRIYRGRTRKGNLLFPADGTPETIQKHCGDHHIYFRLYFSQIDSGNGPGAYRKWVQHYPEKYSQQQDKRSQGPGGYPDQGY